MITSPAVLLVALALVALVLGFLIYYLNEWAASRAASEIRMMSKTVYNERAEARELALEGKGSRASPSM